MLIHISLVVAILLFSWVAVVTLWKKRTQASLLVVLMGAFAFFLSGRILLLAFHLLVLRPNAAGQSWLQTASPLAYSLYLAGAVVLLEEGIRYGCINWYTKRKNAPFGLGEAIGFGLGFGGLQLAFSGLVSLLNTFLLVLMVENQYSGVTSQITTSYQALHLGQIYLFGVERLVMLVAQVLLTVWTYQAIAHHKLKLFGLVLGFHFLIEWLPALSQWSQIVHPLLVEVLLILLVGGGIWWTYRRFSVK